MLRLGGRRPGGGEIGEHDRLTGIETVLGGSGDGVISGSDGVNRLVGAGGDDRLLGGRGNDQLIGGRGADVLSGGSGNDRLGIGDGALHPAGPRDRARCGSGNVTVCEYDSEHDGGIGWRRPESEDLIDFDCEDVPFVDAMYGGGGVPGVRPAPLRRDLTAWTFSNPCRRARLGRCTGRLALARPGTGRPFAQTTFTERGTVRVALGTAAARRLAEPTASQSESARPCPRTKPSVAFILTRQSNHGANPCLAARSGPPGSPRR